VGEKTRNKGGKDLVGDEMVVAAGLLACWWMLLADGNALLVW